MSDYIITNTNKRKAATNDVEKNYYKLLNNSVYGKTMENVRERRNFKIVTSSQEDVMKRNMKKITYESTHVFNPTLAIINFYKQTVLLDKPVFTGIAVLDLSKLLMYQFWYGYLKKKYPNPGQLTLCYTDTDSLLYKVKTPDMYADMLDDKDWFDLSAYPKDGPNGEPGRLSKH